MLLRNLCPPNLCNGIRQRVSTLQKNLIEATGTFKGESISILPIAMVPSDFKTIQFPVKVCFAVTINKSQGQLFKSTGID